MCNNVKNLTSDKIIIQVIQDKNIQTFILDLNRIGQLFDKGETANEEYLGNYSITTERLNKGLGNNKTTSDHITLKDKGDFYKSFFVRIYKDGFTIVANSIKDDGKDLTKIYGKEILGLSDYSQYELYKKIKPMVVSIIEKQILKGVL